ncbi:hypothetical protein [Delftia tsuruhatensis]|uniref:hypothetical protein n=1 Tax=Delftia tsuruhatensis TaxID=180282 RepID=UPI003A853AE9
MTQETKVPGMAVTALAGEIVAALLADEKDGGYDLTAGLFGPSFSALVRRWASAEWSEIVKEREISDEAIKEAALAAGAAKFYPDAQSKKPWGEESFLVTGGFLQRFARAIYAAPAPAAAAGPNRDEIAALRAEHGITSTGRGIKEFEQVDAFVRAALQRWSAAPPGGARDTAALGLRQAATRALADLERAAGSIGSAVDLRAALENPYVLTPPLSEADEAKLLDALKNSQPMGIEPAPAGPGGHVLYGDWDKDAPASIRDRNGQVCLALCRVCGKAEAELTPGERCSGKERT